MKMYKSISVMMVMFLSGTIAIGMDKEQRYHYLPIELRERLIFEAIGTSDSLKMAIDNIKSLILTEKALANRFNESKFCLRVIKTLSNEFNISNQEVATMLNTQEAKRRITLQNSFMPIFYKIKENAEKEGGRRINRNAGNIDYKANKEAGIAELKNLIATADFDVNFSDKEGKTPLYYLIELIMLLDKETALNLVSLFIKRGADPEAGTFTAIALLNRDVNTFKERVKSQPANNMFKERLELYSQILKMFEDAIAKKGGQ